MPQEADDVAWNLLTTIDPFDKDVAEYQVVVLTVRTSQTRGMPISARKTAGACETGTGSSAAHSLGGKDLILRMASFAEVYGESPVFLKNLDPK